MKLVRNPPLKQKKNSLLMVQKSYIIDLVKYTYIHTYHMSLMLWLYIVFSQSIELFRVTSLGRIKIFICIWTCYSFSQLLGHISQYQSHFFKTLHTLLLTIFQLGTAVNLTNTLGHL